MSLNMSIRIIIKIFLAIHLLLLVFRQMIDFAGIQWLMIIVNAIAIIITITAFFGHLRLYGIFQIVLIVYNLFVIGVYSRLITLSNESTTPTVVSLDEWSTANHGGSTISHHNNYLPSTQLLSFDSNSRSFWYAIVSNHVSNLHAHLVPLRQLTSSESVHHQHQSSNAHQPSLIDESLVDLCVQYIEIAIASLHIFISLLGIGLILLKYKLQRDKLSRTNDKTTPPLPPYTISPQMNHYMSYTGTPATTQKGSIYSSKNGSLRRSKRRRSARSLGNSKSKANSMGNLALRASTGSLRSISKQSHRKSVTSLLNDTTYSTNTIGSQRGSSSGGCGKNTARYGAYQPMNPNESIYVSSKYHQPPPPPPPPPVRHSVYLMGGLASQQHAAKLLNSDSETDYYHTFTPSYVNNGLVNPLYGNRNSYLNDSETAI